MNDVSTPMMKQYSLIKKQYQDCLLFYRMGDFYELFLEDARIGARVLNITLTGKANGNAGRIPMAGVPYHAVDAYLAKLIKAGYKVAICEQLSPPNKKGLVERDVVRIVTPGTMLDEKSLEKKANNYIISLSVDSNCVGITVADISTGYFSSSETVTDDVEQTIRDELARLHPAECILPEDLYNNPDILRVLKTEKEINIFHFLEWKTYADDAASVLKKHFGVSTLAGFAVEDKKLTLQTAAALLGYLQQTQKGPVTHIKKITLIPASNYCVLDRSTILNLELFSTIREHDTRGTLLSVLDQTITPMGGRLLKQWLRRPLRTKEEITKRHDAVSVLVKQTQIRQLLREKIKDVNDIERILARLSVGLGNARDLINMKNSLQVVLDLKKSLTTIDSELIKEIDKNIDDKLAETISLIDKNIIAEPPISLREGGLVKSNVNTEVDKLRKIVGGSRELVLELERKERLKTGITTLKVRFNQVFGFYIEVSKSHLSSVPMHYIRRQTLVNGERFITHELKEQEEIILTSEERINDLEYTIYQDILKQVLDQTAIIQQAASSIAILDIVLNFASLAETNNYIRPTLLYSGEIKIKGGRHPVVEKLLEQGNQFVPNDVTMDNIHQQLLLITGPNMAGKSVFIRQVVLIVLMSQIGSFVPAEQAHLSIVDRIFVRSGASDVITSGLSTFMVEMVETAHILHHATENSLIVMDEIGRGTSTYDGISIAWAVAQYLVTYFKIPPKTLFATHYHELQALEQDYPGKIKNFHMAVADDKGEPIFLHTILPGGASHSFGVAVAKLAGIPEPVIKRANELLEELEKRNLDNTHTALSNDDGKFIHTTSLIPSARTISIEEHLIKKELETIDVHNITPLEALNILASLKDKLKLVSVEDKKFLEVD